MELSRYLRETSRTIDGKQQLIVAAFARALEVIPRQLCDNAGFDAAEVVNKLRYCHAQKGSDGLWIGVDINGEGVTDNFKAHTVKAAYILYVVAVCWLLVLPHDQHSQHTYVSENALLPVFVLDGQISGGGAYTPSVPDVFDYARVQTFPAVNAYGILSAPRSDGTESMVLFWSKDVIFLVADEQATGVQTWLEAYHGFVVTRIIVDSNLEGVNGQLANLDLINTVVAISQMEGVYTTLHDKPPLTVDSGYGVGVDEYLSASATVARMMAHQASGFPSGAHGPFHR
ncbi:MAG: hypothetical protein BJ554DRAFT_8270 [Olpidium bornovanus]|uniref:T-complex protein 1 subunit eta n=1 Tax=Olpidium bornovanus TaxID=278681 RepID=A0A8H8DIE8_9FUNG|nr:MAG: hypothetical protein BJ554DRAFT_8270 [Olpidium bornovanus]